MASGRSVSILRLVMETYTCSALAPTNLFVTPVDGDRGRVALEPFSRIEFGEAPVRCRVTGLLERPIRPLSFPFWEGQVSLHPLALLDHGHHGVPSVGSIATTPPNMTVVSPEIRPLGRSCQARRTFGAFPVKSADARQSGIEYQSGSSEVTMLIPMPHELPSSAALTGRMSSSGWTRAQPANSFHVSGPGGTVRGSSTPTALSISVVTGSHTLGNHTTEEGL